MSMNFSFSRHCREDLAPLYEKGLRFDVGIVGWWFASNYGSSLTYFALAKILENSGMKPIFVLAPKLNGIPWDSDTQQTIDFIGKRFRTTKYRDMTHISEVNGFCDSFMLGSDQMWTVHSTNLVGYTFFLDFVDLDKKKIAFSTSFGQDNFDADAKTCLAISDYLKRFDAISVREYTGVDICKKKLGVDADQIIDPIFLCDEEDYDELAQDVSVEVPKKYLFAYILDPNPEKEEAVKHIAEKEGLEIITAFDMRGYDNNAQNWHTGKKLPKPSTEEFLYYIKNCSYLVTDSHHGACMGIIYKRPYVALANPKRGVTRFETVAKAFGLEKRVVYNPHDVLTSTEIYKPIDYDKAFEKIEGEKRRAIEWLDNAFKKKTVPAQETANTIEAKINTLNKCLAYTESRISTAITAIEKKPPVVAPELKDSFDFIKIRYLATLLRDYGIKHIVLSPGGRDVPIVRMFENNEREFVLHRVTDERSAGYYGLGLASQLNKPVACICTSGTAASNYLPAVTEAYFTGVPLIMVTADRIGVYHGQGEDQTIPQADIYRDVVKMAVSLPDFGGGATEHQIKRDISNCILEATHNGNGPVHINIPIQDIAIGANLPKAQWHLLPPITPRILRVGFNDGEREMHKWVASLKRSPRILIVYGQGKPLSKEEKADVDRFASKYNCAIVTDSISNYSSEYSVNPFIMLSRIKQDDFNKHLKPDILITVGGKRLMNDPLTFKIRGASGVRHWSVVPDGKVKDFYFRLTSVIESTQAQFFRWFADNAGNIKNDRRYLNTWKEYVSKHPVKLSEGFDSLYIQDKFFPALPKNSFVHLGVGQSFFFVRRHDIDPSVEVYCNMGTNGIDGCTSTFMGQCAVDDRLSFLIVGDLSFFYDMNGIWNKPLKKNMRILLVNNNGSGLLRNHNLKAVTSVHNTSAEGWVKSTGFEYMSAHSKEEFEEGLEFFMSNKSSKALFFEVFCD
ncbi:MAG: 2-succinyl-5-enolpyruvyl-6-hydroxy-3-cyclohexene-1-carboxylic-acid synthase [Clostridia bacterium]|nr:2-succinyl-5-enolpyruvyl-6-hydroxy-3-cyclohexene-1-carboxylic-acid synthase [Clostridia bacterium]